MYDPTALGRHYALRARRFVELAQEERANGRAIYLRLAEVFGELAASADRFAAALRPEAVPEERKEPAPSPGAAVPRRAKRKPSLRKASSAPALPPAAIKPAERPEPELSTGGDEVLH
jgi:hypothetical protein